MSNFKEIREKLLNEFLNKDIIVYLEGDITTDFEIKNSKIAISNKTLMIADGNRTELIIDVGAITNSIIGNYIVLELGEERITIDY